MSAPQHHPSAATLLAYGAGTLSFASMYVLDQHFACCPSCSDEALTAELLGAALIDLLPGVTLTEDQAEKALNRIRDPSKEKRSRPEVRFDLSTDNMTVAGWGRSYRRLWSVGDASLNLMRLAPGACVPKHRHADLELCFVLKGGFVDCKGTYGAGDICENDQDTLHTPTNTGTEPCVCLVALEKGLRYESPFYRLLQRITRF